MRQVKLDMFEINRDNPFKRTISVISSDPPCKRPCPITSVKFRNWFFKGTVVIWTLASLHERSLEITLAVPLIGFLLLVNDPFNLTFLVFQHIPVWLMEARRHIEPHKEQCTLKYFSLKPPVFHLHSVELQLLYYNI